MTDSVTQFNLAKLIDGLDVVLKGDPNCIIQGVCTIDNAYENHITFLTNKSYRKYLSTTKASAVILKEEDAASCQVNAIIAANPHYTFAKIAAYFLRKSNISAGIHATCVVGADCQIDPTASIGAHCVLGDNVKIAANVVIGPGCVVGDAVEIDNSTVLDARVTLYAGVKIGKRSHLSSGVVVGSDGFSFANEARLWHKVPQLGSVIIGDDVSIGANTTIDCGAVGNTIIENGVKLDNLIQIAHNVKIGANTVIAACVGISGSTTIGQNCMIGGATNFVGHINISDNTVITGMSAVTKSITEPGMYSSGIVGVVPYQEFRKNNARFHRLGNLVDKVKQLETTLHKIESDAT